MIIVYYGDSDKSKKGKEDMKCRKCLNHFIVSSQTALQTKQQSLNNLVIFL